MFARFPAVVISCIAIFAVAAEPLPTVSHDFKIEIAMDMKFGDGKESQHLVGDCSCQYRWNKLGNERTLSLIWVKASMKANDREVMNAKMNRSGIIKVENGKDVEQKIEDSPLQIRNMLRDSFDSPICKMELDESGKEVKRTMMAGPGAKIVIETGMIANSTVFHPLYFTDKDSWKADATVSPGLCEATGKMIYTKVPGADAGKQKVKVSGILKSDGAIVQGAKVKEGTYTVSGTQLYDLAKKEWIAGNLDFEVNLDLAKGEDAIGAKGTFKLVFEMLPEKK